MGLSPLFHNLKLPVIAAPMFLVSGDKFVIEICNQGVVGTFPALNQRTTEGFREWVQNIKKNLKPDAAPFGVNLNVHKSNPRLEADLKEKVPLVITSLGAASEVVEGIHHCGRAITTKDFIQK